MKKIWGAVPTTMVDDLKEFSLVELLSYERENTSNFERQSSSGKVLKDALAVRTDSVHTKMMKFESLLEASGERNIKSINFMLPTAQLTTARLRRSAILRTIIYLSGTQKIKVFGLPDY